MTRLNRARSEHQKWLKKRGLDPQSIAEKKDKSLLIRTWRSSLSTPISTSQYRSHGISGHAQSTKVRNLYTLLKDEDAKTRNDILSKAMRVMPLYNKGGLQLALESDDISTLGSKSRRP